MAKIISPGLASELRGKLGGIVFSRNTWGAYIRNKVSPVQPRTSRQNLIRQKMTLMSQRWRDVLTIAQRDAWTAYAVGTNKSPYLGTKAPLTGLIAYIRFNVQWTVMGQTVLDTAPAIPGEAPMPLMTVTGTVANGVRLTALTPINAVGDKIDVYSNKPLLSQARNFFNGPWQNRVIVDSNSVFPVVVVPPAECAVGQRWYLRARYFDATGKVGPYATISVDILT